MIAATQIPVQESFPNAWLGKSGRWIVDRLSRASATPRPLAFFRIGLAFVLLAQAVALIGHLEELHGSHGIVEWSVVAVDQSPAVPSLSWVDKVLQVAGLPTTWAVPLAFAVYFAGLIGLLLGWRTRLAALMVWFVHTALLTSGDLSMYGADRFAQIGLFYCVWFPVGHALSLDQSAGRAPGTPSFEAWLGLRILQLHVCIIYTASGIEKALGEQWWNGEAIWRALTGMHRGPIDFSVLATAPWLAQGLCWATLVLEAGVIGMVWHPKLRKVWLVSIVGI